MELPVDLTSAKNGDVKMSEKMSDKGDDSAQSGEVNVQMASTQRSETHPNRS